MNIIDLLKGEEGEKKKGDLHYAYTDSEAYWTIDYGILIDVRKGGGLYDEECEFILNNRIHKLGNQLDINIPWWHTQPEENRMVLLAMAFQLGVHGLMGFHEFLSALQRQDWNRAKEEMLNSDWARQTTNRAIRMAGMIGS